MAAYFQLFPKGSKTAATFTSVDEAICARLGIFPDPKYYAVGWYDTIGLAIALGHDWAWMKEAFSEDGDLITVVEFLEANYTTDSWYSRG